MRYIIVEYSNGYAGYDSQKYLCFTDTVKTQEINDYCSEELIEYAQLYEYIAISRSEEKKISDKVKNYYENCTFNWYEINPKEDCFFDKDDWFKVY